MLHIIIIWSILFGVLFLCVELHKMELFYKLWFNKKETKRQQILNIVVSLIMRIAYICLIAALQEEAPKPGDWMMCFVLTSLVLARTLHLSYFCCEFRCSGTGKRFSNQKETSCLPLLNAGFEPRVWDTKSPADGMPAEKPTALSRIKLKTWTRQPVPMISEHLAHSIPLPVGFRTWLWIYHIL